MIRRNKEAKKIDRGFILVPWVRLTCWNIIEEISVGSHLGEGCINHTEDKEKRTGRRHIDQNIRGEALFIKELWGSKDEKMSIIIKA